MGRFSAEGEPVAKPEERRGKGRRMETAENQKQVFP
jgi:hypothetical protein